MRQASHVLRHCEPFQTASTMKTDLRQRLKESTDLAQGRSCVPSWRVAGCRPRPRWGSKCRRCGPRRWLVSLRRVSEKLPRSLQHGPPLPPGYILRRWQSQVLVYKMDNSGCILNLPDRKLMSIVLPFAWWDQKFGEKYWQWLRYFERAIIGFSYNYIWLYSLYCYWR